MKSLSRFRARGSFIHISFSARATDGVFAVVDVDLNKQIRVWVKEELDKQLVEIREQISSLSLRIDEIEREPSKKWNLIPKLRCVMISFGFTKEITIQLVY